MKATRSCSVAGCITTAKLRRGLCARHYMRWYNTGSTEITPSIRGEDLPGEEWRPALGYEGRYEVSNLGRVYSVPRTVTCRNGVTKTVRGGIRRQSTVSSGHKVVSLRDHEFRRVRRYVHQLVLEAFVGPRLEGQVTCHNDGDPGNNRRENLRWDTSSSNQQDSVMHGTHHNVRKTHCVHGHEFNSSNTHWTKGGKRSCRSCQREWKRSHRTRLDRYGREAS